MTKISLGPTVICRDSCRDGGVINTPRSTYYNLYPVGYLLCSMTTPKAENLLLALSSFFVVVSLILFENCRSVDMGSFLSSEAPPIKAPPRVYLLSWPEEASRAREDVKDWYCDFFESLFCIPHKDGKSIVVTDTPDDWPDSRARPGWAHKRLRGAYELLSDGHPRIVRYVRFWTCLCFGANYTSYLGTLKSGKGVLVERLEPGPITWDSLPMMTVPLPQEPSRTDRLILCLYYRWALQVLSALKFAH